jgi:hypothetical protein
LTKDQRRSVVQTFNLTILSLALATHAVAGLLTRQVAVLAAVALPGTVLRRVVRLLRLPPPRRPRLSAHHHGAVVLLRRVADLVGMVD